MCDKDLQAKSKGKGQTRRKYLSNKQPLLINRKRLINIKGQKIGIISSQKKKYKWPLTI